jgi:hypothetical protein
VHVVIGRTYRFLPPGHATPREGADLHFGLGIDRDAQRFRVLRGVRVDLPQVLEDGVGFGNFFLGSVLRTRRNR